MTPQKQLCLGKVEKKRIRRQRRSSEAKADVAPVDGGGCARSGCSCVARGDLIPSNFTSASHLSEKHPTEAGEPAPYKDRQRVTRPCLTQ